MRQLYLLLTAAVVFFASCGKATVESETKRWASTQQTLDKLSGEYPGFKTALQEAKAAGEAKMKAAEGVSKEEEKVKAMSDAINAARRYDGNRLAGDIDAQLEATGMDIREMRPDEFLALVGDVQIDAIQTALLHFEVDGASDDVTRREFGAVVMPRHEAGAIRQTEQAAFAAHRFGDQERLR